MHLDFPGHCSCDRCILVHQWWKDMAVFWESQDDLMMNHDHELTAEGWYTYFSSHVHWPANQTIHRVGNGFLEGVVFQNLLVEPVFLTLALNQDWQYRGCVMTIGFHKLLTETRSVNLCADKTNVCTTSSQHFYNLNFPAIPPTHRRRTSTRCWAWRVENRMKSWSYKKHL